MHKRHGYREKSADLQGTLGYTWACTLFSVYMQYGYKCIYVLREIYKRLGHVCSPCKCCKCSTLLQVSCMFSYRVCMCRMIQSWVYKHTACAACSQLLSILGYSRSDSVVGRIHLVCMCKSVLTQYLWHTYVCIHV